MLYRRELAIALRAPATWAVCVLGALLVGHGFVLALDLFASVSRASLEGVLMRREVDPLIGIVRPTAGGLQLATALLVPIVATRLLALERERGTLGALALAAGSPTRLLVPLLTAATTAGGLVFVVPILLFATYAIAGGRLDAIEIGVVLLGHTLHLLAVVAISLAAAAWTRTGAQAIAIALALSLATWAVDAGDGFVALGWVERLAVISVTRPLARFDAALIDLGALGWFASLIGGAIAGTWVGLRFDWTSRRRHRAGAVVAAITLLLMMISSSAVRRTYDWTELRRASLPPAVVAELRTIDAPIEVTVRLTRDDSRRRQLERDALTKLRLARADLVVVFPLDDAPVTSDDAYGRILVRVGNESRETRSTSRRELLTLVFDAAHRPLPDGSQPEYPGYPFAPEGLQRGAIVITAYVVLPALLAAAGWILHRRRRKR